MLSPFECLCGNFILPESANYVFFYVFSFLRNLSYLICKSNGIQIYDQIASQIKAQIIAGRLGQGEALPSIRLLARELRISVITTKRAYEELEREGYIYTVPGKGSFVSGVDAELLREENLKKIEALLLEALELAESCGIGTDELCEMVRLMEENRR